MIKNDETSVNLTLSAGKPRIILVGVGHIFDIREKVRGIIHRERPQAVALELDPVRFYGLMNRDESRKGQAPFLYQMLARFQSDLAEQYGSEVGSEMVAAADAASEIGAKIALIDMEASTLFNRLRQRMSFKEKTMMIVGVFMAFFARKSTVEKELERYSENEDKFMNEIQRAYPTVSKVLIDERNKFMADRLRELSKSSDPVVAVVGDGHVRGIQQILSEFANVETFRLEDIRRIEQFSDNREMTMSFVVRPPDSKV